jgi:NAD(P)-dependent dehydrogenase (short-subunit alcohol dehydrogenase family)
LPEPVMSTSKRVVLITGGAQGVGKGIARGFLEKGAAVVIADIDAEAAAETASEYAQWGAIAPLAMDVADEASVAAGIQSVLAQHGRLDVLINNAGIMASRPVTALTLSEWNRVLGVNLTGVFLCAKHAAAALKTAHGAIVNIASTRAFMSEPNTEAYAASKGGVVALTHALAASLGLDVRVNCVAPGWIEVSAWKKKADRAEPRLSAADHAQHPAGRVGRPEDIAALVCFLASDEAGFVTGACFTVDGGMTRKMIYV